MADATQDSAEQAPVDAASNNATSVEGGQQLPKQPSPPNDLDLSIAVSPAQAVELHRRAEEIKNGYALLAMKRIENAFSGMDDEEGGGEEKLDLTEEEAKLNAAMTAYATQLQECGVKSGTAEYEAAMAALTQPTEEPAPVEQPPPPEAVVEKVEKSTAQPEPQLPYHDVWNEASPARNAAEMVPPPAAEPEPEPRPATPTPPSPSPQIIQPTAPPAEAMVVDTKSEIDNKPEPPPSKPPGTKKRLPPVVVRQTRGRGARGGMMKQTLAPRTFALSFTSSSTAFPGDSLSGAPGAHANPPAHQTLTMQPTNTPPTMMNQLPLDASVLRAIHPVTSSNRGHIKDLTSYPGVPPLTVGGQTRGGRYQYNVPGRQEHRTHTTAQMTSASSPNMRSYAAGATGIGGIGQMGVTGVAEQLPPLRNPTSPRAMHARRPTDAGTRR